MKIEIFVFFESVNQNLSVHVHVFKPATSEKVIKNIFNKWYLIFKRPKSRLCFRAVGLSPCRIKHKLLVEPPSPCKGPNSISKTIHKGLSLFQLGTKSSK